MPAQLLAVKARASAHVTACVLQDDPFLTKEGEPPMLNLASADGKWMLRLPLDQFPIHDVDPGSTCVVGVFIQQSYVETPEPDKPRIILPSEEVN
jgi:hypothetical protein